MKITRKYVSVITDSVSSGSAAIELALAAPILMLFFLGVYEVGNYIAVVGRVNWAVEVLADQISQTSSVTTTALSNLGSAAGQILYPYSGTSSVLSIGATSYVLDGTYTSDGTCSKATSKIDTTWIKIQSMLGSTSSIDTPTTTQMKSTICPLIDNGGSVIYVSAAYKYQSVTGLTMFSVTIKDHIYLRPRLVSQVTCSNCSA